MAWMETGYDVNHEMRPWISPSLIEANYILSLSQQELQQAIANEMEANPALEIEDRQTCPTCGAIIEGNVCGTCYTNQENQPTEQRIDTLDDYNELNASGNLLRDEDPDFDPMTLIATGVSIPEQILTDAHSILDESEYGIAEYLVESFDERGFLTVTLEDVARALNVSEAAVQDVLDVIQDVAPVGVGSRSLEECLSLQTHFLEQSGTGVPQLVKTVISDYLQDFGSHKFGHIARDLGVEVEEVEDVRDFIRLHLNPFPMQSSVAKSWRSPTEDRYVAPDVIISIDTDELIVEIVDTKYLHLRMNSMYEELAHQFGRKPTKAKDPNATAVEESANHVEDSEKAHVRQYTNRAKIFMTNVQQRRDTLLRISRCIVELQESFLRGGVRDLKPLTRAVVAQQVGVHESTVSRATANKFVMLPTRKVIPFSDFFTASLSTKDIIREMIDQHAQKGEMLTDKRICEMLLLQGVRIARRTVAKYRAELGILPSTIR